MMYLRRLFLFTVAVLCQFPSHVALASQLYRMDNEHFSLRLDANHRFINAEETVRIMIKDWGNPASHVMEQNPLGMIVDKSFPQGSNWGIVITASHDGHVPDKDAKRIDDGHLLTIIRKEYLRMNKQRRAAGSAPVTSLNWALAPEYDRESNRITWAKEIGFGKTGTLTLNYAVRLLGREHAIHMNAVGSREHMDAITRTMTMVLAGSTFDEGYRYSDFNARQHRTADYGLVALIAGQPQLKPQPLQNLWKNLSGAPNLAIAALFGLTVALGRWLTRRRLPEF